jgi:hypothetical protein
MGLGREGQDRLKSAAAHRRRGSADGSHWGFPVLAARRPAASVLLASSVHADPASGPGLSGLVRWSFWRTGSFARLAPPSSRRQARGSSEAGLWSVQSR